MVQEVEIPSVKEVPGLPAADEGLAPAEKPAEEPVPSEKPEELAAESEATETEEVTPSFDPSRYESDESFKSFLDDKLIEARREGQKRERGLRTQVSELEQGNRQIASNLNRTVEQLFTSVQRAIENGMDSDTIARAFAQHAPNLVQFAQWNQTLTDQVASVGGYKTMRWVFEQVAQQATGKADWTEKLLGQLDEDWKFDGGAEVLERFVDGMTQRLTAPLKKKIAALEAELERGKVASRQGGPDTASKIPSTGRPTAAQYAAATSEQRKAWREAGIEPTI